MHGGPCPETSDCSECNGRVHREMSLSCFFLVTLAIKKAHLLMPWPSTGFHGQAQVWSANWSAACCSESARNDVPQNDSFEHVGAEIGHLKCALGRSSSPERSRHVNQVPEERGRPACGLRLGTACLGNRGLLPHFRETERRASEIALTADIARFIWFS